MVIGNGKQHTYRPKADKTLEFETRRPQSGKNVQIEKAQLKAHNKKKGKHEMLNKLKVKCEERQKKRMDKFLIKQFRLKKKINGVQIEYRMKKDQK